MFSYCFINVMEKKIQSLESRNDQADWEGACAVGQRHRSVALSKPTYVGAPVSSPVSVPGSGSGRTLEESSPWQATTLIWPQSCCNLACSLSRFLLVILDQEVGQPVPSTDTPGAQAPASAHVLGRVTGTEQTDFRQTARSCGAYL